MNIRVGLLGPVELRRDGAPVALAGVPQRVLLARLALAAGRAVPVSELIDVLWESEPPENAVGNLHSYVSRLRRCTGGDAVRREPGGYRLDGALDIAVAERLVEAARGQDATRAAATLAEALAVWRGDPLADVADRPAFVPEVARLTEWRRHLREECLERRLDAGDAAAALPEVEAVALGEPLRERAQLLLMRALHVTGRTPEALAVARGFRERLAEEHGIDPSPALTGLQQRILSDDPSLRPAVRVRAVPVPPATPVPVTAVSGAAAVSGPAAVSGAAAVSGPAAVSGSAALSGAAALSGPPAVQVPVVTASPSVLTGPADPVPTGAGRRRTDRFFGRVAELAALRDALTAGRVTTLVGPGGVGKTRLMTEALTGGEMVVELAERSVPADVFGDVAAAVAGALGLRTAPRGGIAALAERLGATPAVLVLDNCEHLLDAVRALVDELVTRCPQVRVLATSRQRLDVAGERVLRLGPLPADDQVALFCDRAALLRADFPDDSRTREVAAEICRLVDGLPLAVELAARREAVFGLTHLRDRLGAGLYVLDPARGGDRATGVAATVEWSYRLLDSAAQRLLDRLAVCRGGFGLSVLPYFTGQGDCGAPDQLLAELVDASLVTCDHSADPPRYRLLETVRHVALGHLAPDAEHEARDAHARWALDLAAELVERGRERDPWTTPTLRRELANLQEALAWLGTADRDTARSGSTRLSDARLSSTRSGAAGPGPDPGGPDSVGSDSGGATYRDRGARLAALLAVIGSDAPDPGLTEQLAGWAPQRVETETEVLCALAAGNATWLRGDLPGADRLISQALDRMPADHPLRWAALIVRISGAMFAGRADAVRADAEVMADDPGAPRWARATGICCAALMDAYGGEEAAGRRWLQRYADRLHSPDGFVSFTDGELLAGSDPEGALACYDRSIAASDRVNQVYVGNVARVARAAVLIRLGRHEQAVAACDEVILAVRDANMTAQVWTMIRLIAELLAALGEAGTAAALVRAADADPLAPAVMAADRERLDRLRKAMPSPSSRPPSRSPSASASGSSQSQSQPQPQYQPEPQPSIPGDTAMLIGYARDALSKAWARHRQAVARRVEA